jgi:hypothetical protein
MLGYYSDRPNSQRYPPGLSLFYPNRGNFIGFVSNLRSRKRLSELKRAFIDSSDFPCESLAAPEWTVVVGLSDHSSFWKQGYPGLMVTDTAFMRNPHYHQASDTADTLDFECFAKVTEGLVGAVKRLASTIEPWTIALPKTDSRRRSAPAIVVTVFVERTGASQRDLSVARPVPLVRALQLRGA